MDQKTELGAKSKDTVIRSSDPATNAKNLYELDLALEQFRNKCAAGKGEWSLTISKDGDNRILVAEYKEAAKQAAE